MKTNELKKGAIVKLANGWTARIEDNMKGNIRMATVKGFVTEMGSIYSHDIVAYYETDVGWHSDIEYTPSQLKCRKLSGALLD